MKTSNERYHDQWFVERLTLMLAKRLLSMFLIEYFKFSLKLARRKGLIIINNGTVYQ